MKDRWRNADGRIYWIKDMSDAHLTNAVRYMRKKIKEEDGFLPAPSYYTLEKEYKKRCEERE